MKSYKDITNKYLKMNKKRTIMTILGIVLSVALITSIGSFLKTIERSLVEDMRKSTGNYHLMFTKGSKELKSRLSSNPKVYKIGFCEQGEKGAISKSKFIQIKKTDKNALELLPYKIKKGNFSSKDNEINLEEWILNYFDKKPNVGDIIKLKLSDGSEKEFKLVGILENLINTQSDGIGDGVINTENIDINKASILVNVYEKGDIKNTVKELKTYSNKENVVSNDYLLKMLGASEEGQSMKSVYPVVAVIIGIVVIATIAVIYNSFHISVVQRIKQFGLLRAVGATPKQIRKIVLREATILSLIAVPIGILCGILAIYAIISVLTSIKGGIDMSLKVVIDPVVLLISALVGLISIYVSALIPARFASKMSPLIAINNRVNIVKENIKKKKSFITKVLKIENAMAFKNLKRNKKRFRITVFSMCISVVLFIVFASFMKMESAVSNKMNESDKMHFAILFDKDLDIESMYKDILNINEVESIYKDYEVVKLGALIDKSKNNKMAESKKKELFKDTSLEGKNMSYLKAGIDIYEDNKLNSAKSYIKEGSIDIKKMNDENGVIIIKRNRIFADKVTITPVTDLKVGDEFYIDKNSINKDESSVKSNFESKDLIKVKVIAVTEEEPFRFNEKADKLKIVASKKFAEKMEREGKNLKFEPSMLELKIKDENKNDIVYDKFKKLEEKHKSIKSIINIIDVNKAKVAADKQMNILIFGFVAVITLIGSVNIVNTMSTNIFLRKNELAAFRAIGMTPKSMNKMIYLEGMLYGVFASIYGSILGVGLTYGLYRAMTTIDNFPWVTPWDIVLVSIVVCMIIGYISVIAPLRKTSKENLIEVLRNE